MKYEALFSPITIGKVTFKNRVVMTPCSCTCYETPEGYITEQEKAYHAARALGGVGLIDVGTVTVTKLHADRRTVGPKMLDSTYYRGLAELADTIHYFGAKAFVQIGTGQGRQVFSKKTWVNPSLDVISASPVPYHRLKENYPPKATAWHVRRGLSWAAAGSDDGLMPREATIEEIEETENTVAQAVPVFKSLGYDGAEIHSSHGYFASSFLSPRLNLRTDKYGGSVENRLRFLLNTIRKARQAVGDDFIIGVRFSLDEHMHGGYTFEFAKVIAYEVEKAGVNYILLSDGCHEAYKYYIPDKSGTMLDKAAELKKVVSIPIITPSVHDPEMAETAIRDGKTDMIGLARGLIAEPNWVNKVASGEPIVECGRCNSGCLIRIHKTLPVKCVKNPESGYEQYNPKYQIREPRGKQPPCKAACPIGQDVADYIEAIYENKLEKAIDLIRRTNPLPAILGRVCTHPCEVECNRGQIDEPIAIATLKRFAADYVLDMETADVTPIPQTNSDKIAVIGCGPSGLSAAWSLAKMGYGVTIFEALPVAGGMLAVGIPEYRLPKKIVQAEIKCIEKLGVDIKLNSPLGKNLNIDDLQKQGYKAIFLAVGAYRSMKLGVPGEELEGVYHGLSFLKDVNLGKEVQVGAKVAIVGGGNVAIDSARIALRLNAKEVIIVYRRSIEEIPANDEEIKQAKQEGIKIHYLSTPVSIFGKDGKVVGMECIQTKLGEPDASGRKRPIAIKGSEFALDANMIILAIGEAPNLSFLSGDGRFQITTAGTLVVNPVSLATNVPGVFAGGDAVSGPATVVEAVAAGKKAAVSIDYYLRGESLLPEEEPMPSVTIMDMCMGKLAKKRRVVIPSLAPMERSSSFKEVHSGLSQEAAVKEADRCFNCSICVQRQL
ncbi:FAD-dependent oxidoreductase [Chloroflexota bacterium]